MKTLLILLVGFLVSTAGIETGKSGYEVGDFATDFKLKNVDGKMVAPAIRSMDGEDAPKPIETTHESAMNCVNCGDPDGTPIPIAGHAAMRQYREGM